MKAYRHRVRANRALTDCSVYDASTVEYSDDGRRIVTGHVKRIIPKRKPSERNYTERKRKPKISVDMQNALDARGKRTVTDFNLPSVYSPEDVN